MEIKDNTRINVINEMKRLGHQFKKNAESFYDPATLENEITEFLSAQPSLTDLIDPCCYEIIFPETIFLKSS